MGAAGATFPPEMEPILVMKYMGWGWRDWLDAYREAPAEILDMIRILMDEEARAARNG